MTMYRLTAAGARLLESAEGAGAETGATAGADARRDGH
jgi:hypothetical protein